MTVKRFNSKFMPHRKLSEKELYKKLFASVSLIVVVTVLLVISLKYFGPSVGGIFGFFSIHRNENNPKDSIAPATPVFSFVPDATNKKSVTLSGITEQGAVVKLFVNGPEKQITVADAGGLFTFANVELTEGSNTVFAKAIDQDNNESDNSEALHIRLDTKKPEIKILEPLSGEIIRNLDQRIEVKGSTNEKAIIKINGRLAVTNADFTFSLLLGVPEGNVEIKVEAVDAAGNKGEEKFNITYVKGS